MGKKNRFHLPGKICTFSATNLNQYQNQDPTKITCLISTKSTQTRIFSDHNSVWYLIRTIGVSMAIFIDLVIILNSLFEQKTTVFPPRVNHFYLGNTN